MNSSALRGKSFGQKPPPLTNYLHSLIRDYPKGIGIVKEFVQNADDAGATCMKILFDWRSHPIDTLPSPEMASLMGPAVLFFNDATFTDKDLEGITLLSQGSKSEDTGKTGRFGLGFNSAYNVTDVPSFVSRSHIYFFDPHGRTVFGASAQNPGQSWPLKELWTEAPDLLSPFLPLGLKIKQNYLPATIFRLPFRTDEQAKRSDLSKEPFSREDTEGILGSLETIGAELLLFLRHLTSIEVYEISESLPTMRQRCSFKTLNAKVVKERRDQLRSRQQQNDVLNLLKTNRRLSVTYKHVIKVESDRGRVEQVWRVVNGLYCDPDGKLVEEAKTLKEIGEKVFPGAGAAALVSGGDGVKPQGSAYCFLPLPVPTNLPVHVHGYFDLDRSRQKLTDGQGLTGNDAKRGRWNALLIEHAVANAYAELLLQLRDDIGEADPLAFYGYWPTSEALTGLFEEFPHFLLEHLLEEKVISTTAPSRWYTLRQTTTLKSGWGQLKEPLALKGLPIAEPKLPVDLVRMLRGIGEVPGELTPNQLVKILRLDYDINRPLSEVEQPWLKESAWLQDMLRFCLLNVYEGDIKGLPLALMADGRLRTFGYVKSLGGTPVDIYLGGLAERSIFKTYSFVFLDETFVKETGLKEDIKAYVKTMTPSFAIRCLPWILDKERWTQPGLWQPDSESLPNGAWLKEVYEYLTDNKDNWWDDSDDIEMAFQELPLVPDQFGALRLAGFNTTPLLPSERDRALEQALAFLDVPIVSADEPLKTAISHFVDNFEYFIRRITPLNLIDTLSSLSHLGDEYEAEIHGPILDFFSAPAALSDLKGDLNRRKALAELQLFPVSGGALTSLRESGVFLSAARDLPPDLFEAHFLKEGQDNRWRSLLKFLNAPELTEDRVVGLILANYEQLSREGKLEALTWIRRNISRAEGIADSSASGGAKALRNEISEASLILCDDDVYRSPAATYSPTAELPRKVLGSAAPLPDMKHYAEAPDSWLTFFAQLGMAQSPRPDDLVAYLDKLIALAERDGVRSVEPAIREFWNHISTHWIALSDTTSGGFAQHLARRSWLPSRQAGGRDIPGFVAPKDKLYAPSEVFTATWRLAVASQAPTLNLATVTSEMQLALGFPERPEDTTVLKHFDHLLELWEAADHSGLKAEPFQQSLDFIYRFLGRSPDSPELAKLLEGYDSRDCLWDPSTKKLWAPKYAFAVSTSVFGSRRIQLRSTEPALETGYKALGRRAEVESRDYLIFLDELLIEYGEQELSQEDQGSTLRVLARLSEQILDPTKKEDVPVLTQAGKLSLAQDVYLADAPWFENRVDNSIVAILNRGVAQNFALSVGVNRLSESIQEDLNGVPERSNDGHSVSLCQAWQRTLRSPEFARGVRRLAEHDGKTVRLENLRWLQRITVVPTREIRTTLSLRPNMRNVGHGTAEYFFDPSYEVIYLTEPPLAKLLADAVNREFEGASLLDTSSLIQIITTAPEHIDHQLDRLRITRTEQEVNEEMDTADEGADLENDVGADITLDEITDDVMAEGEEPWTSSAPFTNEAAEPTIEITSEHADAAQGKHSRSESSNIKGDAGFKSAQNGGNKADEASSQKAQPRQSDDQDSRPKRGESSESSQDNSRQKASLEKGSKNATSTSDTKQRRHRTFVYAEHENDDVEDDDKDEGTSTRAQQIGSAAEMKVMAIEHKEGRAAKHHDRNNEGFDISSSSDNGEKRYIEVKGIDGPWGNRGVAMTAPQFKMALEYGDEYWLYIVEYALDDENVSIKKIRNPAEAVIRYVFDAGWKDII